MKWNFTFSCCSDLVGSTNASHMIARQGHPLGCPSTYGCMLEISHEHRSDQPFVCNYRVSQVCSSSLKPLNNQNYSARWHDREIRQFSYCINECALERQKEVWFLAPLKLLKSDRTCKNREFSGEVTCIEDFINSKSVQVVRSCIRGEKIKTEINEKRKTR